MSKADKFRDAFAERFGNEWELMSVYSGYDEPVTVRHIPCGEIVTMKAAQISKTKSDLKCKKCNAQARLLEKAKAFHDRFDTELGHEWERLSEFKGSHEMLTARHIPCGEIRTAEANKFFRCGCVKCGREQAATKRVSGKRAELVQRVEAEYNVTSISDCKGTRTPHKWRCNVCGAEIERSIENILFRGNGYGGGLICECQKPVNYAPLIKVLKRGLKKRIREEVKRVRMAEEIQELCDKYSENGYEIIEILDDLQSVTIKHLACGRIYTTDKSRMKRGHGCKACAKCGTSYGVQQIEKYLRDNNIKFDREATFPTCKRERVLPFDFAVYDDAGALKCLIEFQGEQHYRARPMFGGEEKLRRVQEADAIKRQWARDNGINLIVIDWNEDISGRVSSAGL